MQIGQETPSDEREGGKRRRNDRLVRPEKSRGLGLGLGGGGVGEEGGGGRPGYDKLGSFWRLIFFLSFPFCSFPFLPLFPVFHKKRRGGTAGSGDVDVTCSISCQVMQGWGKRE